MMYELYFSLSDVTEYELSVIYRVSQKKCNELHFPRSQGK